MPRPANREMLTPPPRVESPRPFGLDGGSVRMRCDDGSGRVVQARPRTMSDKERRNFGASIENISRAHDEDLQALADI